MTLTDTHPVHALNQTWCDAFNARDLPLMMGMYEPDAVLVPGPDAEPLCGHPAIEAALRGFIGLGGQLRFTPRYWLINDDLAMGSIAFVLDGAVDNDGHPVDWSVSRTQSTRSCPHL